MIVELLPSQLAFIDSEAKHTGFIGGYGSGKSFAGVMKTVKKKLQYPGISVAYYLPTYPLIRDIAFPKFTEMLNMLGIRYVLNKTDKDIITPYGNIILRSMDNPDLIVGYEVGYSLIDETDILPTNKMSEVFVKIIARNRSKLPNEAKNITDVVGTPEGFKWAYKFFVKERKQGRVLIKAKTKDNKFLPDDYVKTLEETYTPQQLEAYLNGEFINMTTGNVYRNYNRILNRSMRKVQDNDTLHIGMDFNITNMNAVVHVIDDFPIAVCEITKSFDTQEICALIKTRYPNNKIIIYPDASGASRKTSGKSDHEIIRLYGFTIKAPSANPFVKDRVNAMNLAFLNKDEERKYFVNDYECPVYAEALERHTYKNGEPDKQSGFDHITEAAGYFIYNTISNIQKLHRIKVDE